jgi:D-inositol-3-phosphate glycosyltransferase
MDRPRIAMISEHAFPLAPSGSVDCGGQNVYVANVARELAGRGWAVDVFTRREDAGAPIVTRWIPGVRVVSVPAGPPRRVPKESLLPFMEEFAEWTETFARWQSRPYDVVHAHFFMSAWVGLRLRRRLGVPLAVTFHALGRVRRAHQSEADGFPDVRFDIEQCAMDEADVIVAECPEDLADMRRFYRVDPGRVRVVPCGFDPGELHPLARRHARHRLGMPQAEFSVLQLGRMVPRKGVDTVTEAIALLRGQYRIPAVLYVVGGNSRVPDAAETPEIGRLSHMASDLGIGDHVHFVGQRDRHELAQYYCASNVFVTTPWYEPFGITPLEAMACARPVVGADVGGIRFSVVHGRTGFLVPPRDPQAVARCLARLHHDRPLARAMGRLGRVRATERFTWSSVVDQLVPAYRVAVLSANRANSAIGRPVVDPIPHRPHAAPTPVAVGI